MGQAELLSLLALLVATVALYFTLGRPKAEPSATDKAFKRLESDVESVFEKVESHLGRISRLKRGATPASPSPDVAKQEPVRLSRAGLLANSRRTYAESNRYGAGKERNR